MKTDRFERGSYMVFDTATWDCMRKVRAQLWHALSILSGVLLLLHRLTSLLRGTVFSGMTASCFFSSWSYTVLATMCACQAGNNISIC